MSQYMYYHENTIVYYNGTFLKASEAKGNLYDQSLHYGYAVFEGIRAYATEEGVRIFKAKEHFERMQYSCEAIGIPYPYINSEIINLSYELLKRNNLKNAYLRPLVTCTPNMSLTKGKEPQLLLAAWEWSAYLGEKLLRIKTSPYRRICPANFIVKAKVSGHYVNSILATQEAKDTGYDEALMLDVDGFVAEGSGANFFLEDKGILYTPESDSILPGITRATVLEICAELGIEVVRTSVKLEDVYEKDSAFFCGTAAEIIGIDSLDNRSFTKPWNTSLGAIIQKAYKNLVLQKPYSTMAIVA
ncbi:MAG: branched-chain amino acid transaminase [Chitinophagaceae bacterium]